MAENISNNHIAKRYSTLFAIILAVSLLLIAIMVYPGGSRADKNSVGFDWKNNYVSNLFTETAINGSHNLSRVWAISGMFFLSITFAVFFTEFSKRIPSKGAGRVIKYFGIAAMICTFLVVTPYHDTMITVACTLTLSVCFTLPSLYLNRNCISSKFSRLFASWCFILRFTFITVATLFKCY